MNRSNIVFFLLLILLYSCDDTAQQGQVPDLTTEEAAAAKSTSYRAAPAREMTPLLEQISSLPTRYRFAWLPSTRFHLSSFGEVDFQIAREEPLAIYETVAIELVKDEEVVLTGQMQSSLQCNVVQRHYYRLHADSLLLVDFDTHWQSEVSAWKTEVRPRILAREGETWTSLPEDALPCLELLSTQTRKRVDPLWATWAERQLHIRVGAQRLQLSRAEGRWRCVESEAI